MKNIIRNAYIAKMTGLAEYKNDKEIWWKDGDNYPITIEFPTSLISYAVVREYWENGNLWCEKEYQNGKLHGKCLTWYQNGNLYSQEGYKRGKLHGKVFEYYKNGRLECELLYKNGKPNGKFTSWYEDGEVEHESEYQNGKIIREKFVKDYNQHV